MPGYRHFRRNTPLPKDKTMNKTGFLFDDRYLNHVSGDYHPENPERLRVIARAVKKFGLLSKLSPITAEIPEMKWIEAVHDGAYIKRFEQLCRDGVKVFDYPDNQMCPETFQTALLAAGGILKAARMVMTGELDNAFCAVRPPGHHAEYNKAMGFCYFANVAIAARYIMAQFPIERVGIIDFDVHHGNGTQHIFEKEAGIFYYSIHEHPSFAFPGTGRIFEKGIGPGTGYTKNYPVLPGEGDETYHKIIETDLIPTFDGFKPQVIIVSTGFDAHKDDIMSGIKLTTKGYAWIMEKIMALADKYSDGRIISVLEGGYSLKRLPELAVNHLEILLNIPLSPESTDDD
jgi:acetoin utilization deacetylase AcuC-like enzyme